MTALEARLAAPPSKTKIRAVQPHLADVLSSLDSMVAEYSALCRNVNRAEMTKLSAI
jgi:hypothetical protein